MAKAGALSGLLDELRAGGEVDSHGRFTLDRAQARAKMQKFQLADPRRYVLELVQAAILRGATAIDFVIDADDMHMRFDGQPFTAAELDDLWGSIFADGDSRELRGLRQLALGLNAALGLDPRSIVVRSGGLELRLQPGRDDAMAPIDPPVAGTTIHVKQRLRPGLVVAFIRNLGGRLGEEIHLRERCGHAPVPITLDGAPIVRGLHVEGAIAEQPIVAPGVQGVIGLVERDQPAELRLLKDGVWIDSQPLEQCGPGFVAIVAGDALRKDVSLAKIVADEALAQIVGLARVARWSVLARVVEAVQRGERPAGPAMTRVRAEALQFLKLRDLRKHPDAANVGRALVWPDARGFDRARPQVARPVSLTELVEAVTRAGDPAHARLRWAFWGYPLLTPEGDPVPRFDEAEAKSVGRLLGCQLVRLDDDLERAHSRERARRAWLIRTMEPRLPADRRYLLRGPLAAPGVRGELGVRVDALVEAAAPRHHGTVWLLRQGALLGQFELDWGVAALDVAIEAEFTPTDSYEDVVRESTLLRAVLHVLAALSGPLAQLAAWGRGNASEAGVRGLVKAWLLLVFDDETRANLWQRLGVSESLRPDEAFVRTILPAPARLHADRGPLAPFLDLPLFEDFDGARRTLRELGERLRRIGGLDELDRSVLPEAGVGREVLWLGRGDRKIVAGLFGEEALRSWLPVLEARWRERDFRARPQRTIADTAARMHAELRAAGLDPGLWCRSVAVDGIEAVITLAQDGKADAAKIDVLYQGRLLAERTFDLGIGPIVGAATSPNLRPRASWDDVEYDQALEALLAALRAAAWALVGGLLRRHAELGERRAWLVALVLERLARLGRRRVPSHFPELQKLPLLRTIDGGALSVNDVDAVIREHKRIEWVPAKAPDSTLRDPPMLREDTRVIEALRELVGAEAVVEGRERLHRHGLAARLENLPTIEHPSFPRDDVWCALSLAGGQPKLEGEVGLSRTREGVGLRLVLCTAGRRVGEVTEDDSPVPVDAIIADPELPMSPLGEIDTRSKRYGLYLRRCRRILPKLIVKLCKRFQELSPVDRERARVLLLAYAEAEAKAGPGRRESREDAWEAVRGLPLLVDVWGARHTLAEVEARSKPRGVDVVTRPVEIEGDAAQFGRLILVVDPPTRRCLAAMVEVHELDDRWAEELLALNQLARAPDVVLPELREVAWVDHKATVAGGLQAHLWIPRKPGDDVLVFARGRKEVGRLGLLAAMPCAGIVSGYGLSVGIHGVELDARQRSSLAKQICVLYEALAKQTRSNRFNVDERERIRAWLARIDQALADHDGDPLLAGIGKPLERLKQALGELVPPALRRAKTRTAKPEPAKPEPPRHAPPKPEPATTVAPAAPLPAAPEFTPTPEQKLLSIVRAELEWARVRHGTLLDRLGLDRLALGTGWQGGVAFFDRGVVLQQHHPLVARQLARLAAGREPDPIDLAFLASAVYTVMNAVADEIDADDERAFVGHMAAGLALGLAPRE